MDVYQLNQDVFGAITDFKGKILSPAFKDSKNQELDPTAQEIKNATALKKKFKHNDKLKIFSN